MENKKRKQKQQHNENFDLDYPSEVDESNSSEGENLMSCRILTIRTHKH